MADSSDYEIHGSGNVIGDRSQGIVQSVSLDLDTEPIRHLTNRLEETTAVIDSLSSRLPPPEKSSSRDWPAYVILSVFVLFSLAVVIGPLWLYEFSSRLPNSTEIQNLILTLSSAMSGVTGLLGVLLGSRIRLFKT